MELETAVLFVLALGGWLFLNWQIGQTRKLIIQLHPEAAQEKEVMKWLRKNRLMILAIVILSLSILIFGPILAG